MEPEQEESLDQHLDVIPEAFLRVADPKKRALLIAMTVTPVIGHACEAAGVSTRTLYNWRCGYGDTKPDSAFVEAYKVARELGIISAEDEAWKRATAGTTEDVYGNLGTGQGTGVVGQRQVKSDTMLIFMLKGVRPDVYRDRVDITGKDGGAIETVTRIENIIVDPKV